MRYVRISALCDVSSGAVKYAGHCDILVFTKMDFLDAFVIIVRMNLRNDVVSVSVYMHRLLFTAG